MAIHFIYLILLVAVVAAIYSIIKVANRLPNSWDVLVQQAEQWHREFDIERTAQGFDIKRLDGEYHSPFGGTGESSRENSQVHVTAKANEATICCYCRGGFKDDKELRTVCSDCGAVQHADCFVTFKSCPNCQQSKTIITANKES